jgi:hypothetical protein
MPLTDVARTIKLNGRKTSGALSELREPIEVDVAQTYTNGTGANKANEAWQNRISLAGAPTSLDLTALAKTGAANVTFSKIKEILVKNRSAVTGQTVKIGGTATPVAIFDDASDIITIGPGGHFSWSDPIDGVAITDGVDDLLQLDPGAATISVDVYLVGEA